MTAAPPRFALLLAVLVGASGCGLTRPLVEGDYLLEVVALVEDSCGYTEEDVGVGSTAQAALSWDGNILELDFGTTTWSFLWQYEVLSAESYQEVAIDDTCVLLVDSAWTGEVLARDRFGVIEDMVLDWGGDCSAWDVSNMPCLTSTAIEGDLLSR